MDRFWRRKLTAFLDRIRNVTIGQSREAFIDFSDTERLGPGGTLLFLAEIDRIKRARRGERLLSCNFPRNRIVEQVLQQVGILDILGRKARLVESRFGETVRHWRFATGNSVEGEKVEPFVGPLDGRLAASLTDGLYVGLTEAMTNCSQHAYEEHRQDGIETTPDLRRWWMFSQEKDGLLSVAFCDLGMGIPRSLDVSRQWDKSVVASILSRLNFTSRTEANLIRAAMELRKTRTQLSHRGKGLPQILDVVREAASGFLQIHSNRGMFHYNAASDKEILEDFPQSIRGTLILWELPLPKRSQLALPFGEPQ